ncbi:unnamed protein product, partial [Meganyctiphanes norvegica]
PSSDSDESTHRPLYSLNQVVARLVRVGMDTCGGWSRRSSGTTIMYLMLLLLVLLGATCDAAPQVVFSEDKVEGQTCGDTGLEGSGPGVCRSASQCPQVLALLTPVRCGTDDANVIVCCPQTNGVPPPPQPPINPTIPGAVPGGVPLPPPSDTNPGSVTGGAQIPDYPEYLDYGGGDSPQDPGVVNPGSFIGGLFNPATNGGAQNPDFLDYGGGVDAQYPDYPDNGVGGSNLDYPSPAQGDIAANDPRSTALNIPDNTAINVDDRRG